MSMSKSEKDYQEEFDELLTTYMASMILNKRGEEVSISEADAAAKAFEAGWKAAAALMIREAKYL